MEMEKAIVPNFWAKHRPLIQAEPIDMGQAQGQYFKITFEDGSSCTMSTAGLHEAYETIPPAQQITAEWMEGIRLLADLVHTNCRNKGWWDKPRETGTVLMLAVTELAEAMEEHRHNHPPTLTYFAPSGKPEGFGIELADTIIRLLDTAAGLNIDIAECIRVKHAYNTTRPERHGGKAC